MVSQAGKNEEQEKDQSEIADPRSDLFCVVVVWCILCGVCVLVCYVITKRQHSNYHFKNSNSDDWFSQFREKDFLRFKKYKK